ncbi:beta-1,4-N-acetylgalactosaminyltransferase bre-4-like [Sycon ciliatum]|uniref:beta-1,4-N-acetylgalactosaminyltransferase bre-4-like n=1 Tax=Sycon ciliatum TaxID=27933 RepID=UPI0031F6CEB1
MAFSLWTSTGGGSLPMWLDLLVIALIGFICTFTVSYVALAQPQGNRLLNNAPTPTSTQGEREMFVAAPGYLFSGEDSSAGPMSRVATVVTQPSTTAQLTTSHPHQAIVTKTHAAAFFPGGGGPSKTRVAIVVPFRNRYEQLKQFAPAINAFLAKQDIIFKVFIVEQLGKAKFNRGALLNIGFLEANSGRTAADRFDCMTIHDIDLIPLVSANSYDCKKAPLQKAWQLSSAIDMYNWDLPQMADGGVNLLPSDVYWSANGFSNRFYGWGGEDNDLKTRLQAIRTDFVRRDKSVGRYSTLKKGNFKSGKLADNRWELLRNSRRLLHEGLTTARYRLLKRDVQPHYTLLSVDIWLSEDADRRV